jgi:hypothetical protein
VNDVTILEAAAAIRPYLLQLVGANAQTLEEELVNLLSAARRGEEVDDRILANLQLYRATAEWTANFFDTGRPPEIAELTEKGYDFVWYRRAAGQPLPECPTHHVPLEASTHS